MDDGTGATPGWIVARLRAAGCVFAEDEAQLLAAAARSPADLISMVDRRAAGEPVEHVVGWAGFRGLRIIVGPGVFVPRRRTEFLVDRAVAVAQPHGVVVDLCCGSGAIGAAIAAAIGPIELHAADIDPIAVASARRNTAAAGGAVHVGDLYDALPAALLGRVDVLVANTPYVPTDAIALMPAGGSRPRASRRAGRRSGRTRHPATGDRDTPRGGWQRVGTSSWRRARSRHRRRPTPVRRAGLQPRVERSAAWDATVVIGSAGVR
jgi:release factor glutamine methyltransferase